MEIKKCKCVENKISEINKAYQTLLDDMEKIINKNCIENGSNTPDFLLANYLIEVLKIGQELIKERDKWYSINPYPAWEGSEKIEKFTSTVKKLEQLQNNIEKSFEKPEYIIGLYNGYEIALSLLKKRKPECIKIEDKEECSDIFHDGDIMEKYVYQDEDRMEKDK